MLHATLKPQRKLSILMNNYWMEFCSWWRDKTTPAWTTHLRQTIRVLKAAIALKDNSHLRLMFDQDVCSLPSIVHLSFITLTFQYLWRTLQRLSNPFNPFLKFICFEREQSLTWGSNSRTVRPWPEPKLRVRSLTDWAIQTPINPFLKIQIGQRLTSQQGMRDPRFLC